MLSMGRHDPENELFKIENKLALMIGEGKELGVLKGTVLFSDSPAICYGTGVFGVEAAHRDFYRL